MATYAQIAAGALRRLGSDSRFTTAMQEEAAREALHRYSRDIPRARITASAAGTGVGFLALPADFYRDFSELIAVETPTGEDPPSYLESDEVSLEVVSNDTLRVRLKTRILTTSDTWSLIYTTLHTVNGLATFVGGTAGTAATSTTIGGGDDSAFMDLVAHYGATYLQGEAADNRDPNIAADTIDQGSEFDRYGRLAEGLLDRYEAHIRDDRTNETRGGYLDWTSKRRGVLFMHTVQLSRWEPGADRIAPYLILR